MLFCIKILVLILGLGPIATAEGTDCPTGAKLFKRHKTWSECCKDNGQKNCMRDGPYTSYQGDGKPSRIAYYKNGKKDGQFIEFDKLGNELVKGEFSNDRPSGTWVVNGLDGKILEIIYSQNSILEVTTFIKDKKITYKGSATAASIPKAPMSGFTPNKPFEPAGNAKDEKNVFNVTLFFSDSKKTSIAGAAIDFMSTARYDLLNYRFFPDSVINSDRNRTDSGPFSWFAYEHESGLCHIAISGMLQTLSKEDYSTHYTWVECPQFRDIMDSYRNKNTILYVFSDEIFYDSPNGRVKKIRVKSDQVYKIEIVSTKTVDKVLWSNIKLGSPQLGEIARIDPKDKNVDFAWIPFYKGINPVIRSKLEDLFFE